MKPPERSFAALLGGSRELALFESLALRPDELLSAAELSRFSGVPWATTHRRLDDWAARGVVIPEGKFGKAQLYRLNTSSPAIRALSHGVGLAVSEILQAELRREGVHEPDEPRCVSVLEWVDADWEGLKWNEPTPMHARLPELPH